MKTELKIARTPNGYVVTAMFPAQCRDGKMPDLSHRPDLSGSEVKITRAFRTTQEAQRAMDKLKAKANKP